MCRPLAAMPRIAKLSASVPPLRKTISDVSALMSLPPRASERHRSTISHAVRTNGWTMALPKCSVNTGIIAATTSGRMGVVALLSR